MARWAIDGFKPGFRLSVLDAVVLAAGSIAALALAQTVWWAGFIVAFAVGHFFLFCNIVRMRRALEVPWAALFTALAAGTLVFDVPGWPATITLSLLATAAAVTFELRSPSYHGLGWRAINPQLPAWWQQSRAKVAPRSEMT